MLYNIVLVSAVQQSESPVCICISPPSKTAPHQQSHPSRSPQSTELSSREAGSPLAICFIRSSVCMSILISQLTPLPLPHTPVSTCLFCTSPSLFLPYKWVHRYHFSRLHIYALIYDIFLFLTYFTLINSWNIMLKLSSIKLCLVFLTRFFKYFLFKENINLTTFLNIYCYY